MKEDIIEINKKTFIKEFEEKNKNKIDTNYLIYWHYTTRKNFTNIVKGEKTGANYIYFSNLSKANDVLESYAHTINKKIHFLSLSKSKFEILPMWSMYGGIDGNGIAIGFTPSKLLKWISSIQVAHPVIDGVVNEDIILRKGVDFEITRGDICYIYNSEKNRCFFKCDNTKYLIKNDTIVNDDFYFYKSIDWDYEKEYRIVIKNISKKTYEKVAIKISSNILKCIKVINGPIVISDDEDWRQYLDIKSSKIKNSNVYLKKK